MNKNALDLRTLSQSMFGFAFPPNPEKLQSKFRAMVKEGRYRHPDKGGNHEDYIYMKDVYEQLLPHSVISGEVKESEILIGGRPLSQFGRGLDSITNGVSCEDCEGRGYFRATRLVTDYSGPTKMCWVCQGRPYTGSFSRYGCVNCSDEGRVYTGKKQGTQYWKCSPCEGTGEIYLMNPVLQKGGLR